MRSRLSRLVTGSVMILSLAPVASALAQQQRERDTANPGQSAGVGQDRNQQTPAETETIRGVIAAVTAEGEAMFDFRSNRAVAAEAMFLTVVGSPAMKSEGPAAERTGAADSDRSGSARRKRHNVYYVWLSPQTKVCESSAASEKAGQSQGAAGQKAEVALDRLEVGDHVEIQFTRREDSAGTQSAHQTEQMRNKHGRHRTFVGSATSVTILTAMDQGHENAGRGSAPTSALSEDRRAS